MFEEVQIAVYGEYLYAGYFILNVPRIDCTDFPPSSLTNYLPS